MTELPDDVQRLLEQARAADQPSEADRVRVRAALLASIAAGAGTATSAEAAARASAEVIGEGASSAAGGVTTASATASAGGAAGAGLATSAAFKWGAGLLVAAAATTALVTEPWNSSPRSQPSAPAHVGSASAATTAPTVPPAPLPTPEPAAVPLPPAVEAVPEAPPAAIEPSPVGSVAPVVPVARVTDQQPAPVARRRPNRRAPVGKPKSAPAQPVQAEPSAALPEPGVVAGPDNQPPKSPLPPASTAEEVSARPAASVEPLAPSGKAQTPALPSAGQELALIQRATRALNHGQAARALVALVEHGRRFPRGMLTPERQALRVLTLCKLERLPQGRRERDRFLARHAGSPLVERVRAACGSSKP